MSYSQLDAINLCLMANSELPINNAEDPEDLQVAKVKPIIEQVLREELRKMHNFNTFEQEFVPDADGNILVPDTFMSIFFSKQYLSRLTIRNKVVWDREKNAPCTDKFTSLVTLYVSFEDCPELFRELIAYRAAQQYYAFYGPGPGTAGYQRLELKARKASVSFYNSEYHKLPSNFGLLYSWHGNVGLSA